LDSTQIQTFDGRIADTEFGNISLAAKRILCCNCCGAVTSGLAITFPTSADAFMSSVDQAAIVIMENEAYKLQPFLAIHRTPVPDSWITFYAQCEFAANGNPVVSNGGPAEVYTDQNFMFLDLAMGHWLFRNCSGIRCHQRGLTGVAAITEFHFSTTLTDTDSVAAGPVRNNNGSGTTPFSVDEITNPFNRMDIFNWTNGLRFQFGEKSFVTLAGVVPLRADEERVFDAEFALQYARVY
jgi:hypothetical protein